MNNSITNSDSSVTDIGKTEKIVHLNNAGTSLPPSTVTQTVVDYLKWESQIGGYEAATLAKDRIGDVYTNLAKIVGAKSHEIAFVDSGTRAWNNILYAYPFSPGDIILTSQNEFGSNVVSLAQIAKNTGAQVIVIPNEADGRVSLSELKKQLNNKVKLVAITHVVMQRGIVNPIIEIGSVLRNRGIFYLVDACQSVGQMEIDVNRIGCDALTTTGRKWLRGPRGTGFFYLRENWISKFEPSTVDLAVADLAKPELMLKNNELIIRDDIKRFEMWERSIALMLGLGSAAEYAMEQGISQIHKTVVKLASMIRSEIANIVDLQLGESINSESGIVSITSQKHDVEKLKTALFDQRINTSVVHNYDGPLDFYSRNLHAALRVSPHYYNTENDIEIFLKALYKLV